MSKVLATVFLLLMVVDTHGSEALDAFPGEVDGKLRHVINLPKVVDESRFRVELIPGKSQIAACNLQSFSAPLRKEILPGWGYPFYVLSDLTPTTDTQKVCAQASETRRFITVRGDGLMLPYNSRLPLVIYLPQGVQLKYRVWRADKNFSEAKSK
ncbi:ecotin [Microbulbifer sp. A4B17]|uniref:ecotin family protein n=1 Tax=Microbulbifer sp. A4B17 TaxID=359370 RepID=UPI000D52EE5B|nr:ecotin family protein [Microbulbifer sp. A4B17]AWF79400.1 ecotin [Microbulbifer sp. A4B17]